MTANLYLRLLGTVQVEREGQPVSGLQSGLRLALLGYLVAQRQPLPREHLTDLLWQELPAERGRANLSWTVHKLSVALPFLAWPRSVRGQLARALGDYAPARSWFKQAVAIQRSFEHKPGIANALIGLADCWYLDNDRCKNGISTQRRGDAEH